MQAHALLLRRARTHLERRGRRCVCRCVCPGCCSCCHSPLTTQLPVMVRQLRAHRPPAAAAPL